MTTLESVLFHASNNPPYLAVLIRGIAPQVFLLELLFAVLQVMGI